MDHSVLRSLGWKPCYGLQMSAEETQSLTPVRVGCHQGSQILCLSEAGDFTLSIQLVESCGALAVGDWILYDPRSGRCVRRLERESLIDRKAAGSKAQTQLVAANVDTLLIVSSCNHDFNLSRLERYLAVASQARVNPVVVLTKADLCGDPEGLRQQASGLLSGLIVETIDARDASQLHVLSQWCGVGQTVAFVGSSGVGKSTLANSMGANNLATQEIRQDDSKGRHTTTARSIHRLEAGGVMIDTPGMRELQLTACPQGVEEVFDEIVHLAKECRFRDCGHQGEPGCAVIDAIENGELEPRRLISFRKLQSEQARNAQSIRQQRSESRKQGQFYKSVIAAKRKRRG